MIAEQIHSQTNYAASTKYYQFSTILEHVIDCFHTIVTDETNPYHPPLGWLTRKQPKPPEEELSIDLHDECSKHKDSHAAGENVPLSSSVRNRLEKYPQQVRQEIVSRTRDGCAPLFLACKNGLTRVVKYLLDICGADIEQRGRFETLENHHVHSVTPIWVAAVSGHLDTVRLLIDRGANVDSISDTGSTPLRSACFLCKDDDGIEEYDYPREDDYRFGGGPEEADEGDIYIKIVRLLVDNGADLKRSNYNGGTCLINALHNYRLASYIISHGVDINAADSQSKTALHYAIQQNRVSVAKLLLVNGADPYLLTRDGDDALRLSCIGGHEEMFEHLISNYEYDRQTVSDAYKLLGSSILEIHYDLTRVREYWSRSIELMSRNGNRSVTEPVSYSDRNSCDIRRSKAFRGMVELHSETLMQSLTVDHFRIQSLLISERILGPNHRETIQRLLYRGTFYINSLRPIQCLDLWIYALKLRLEHESIFQFESIFAAQAITKLFLDLMGQRQQQYVRFDDVHEVVQLLIGRIDECERLLRLKPRSCVHEDIYDLILDMIVKLLLILRCTMSSHCDEQRQTKELVKYLVVQNPKTANGSSLLHICVEPNMFEGEIYRSIQVACEMTSSRVPTSIGTRSHSNADDATSLWRQLSSNNVTIPDRILEQQRHPVLNSRRLTPLCDLVEDLIDAGLELDQVNNDGLSALQVLCLASGIQVTDKANIVGLLVKHGAHVDRRAGTPEEDGRIQQALRECGINPFRFVTLKCLAARRVSELRLSFDKTMLASNLRESIAIH